MKTRALLVLVLALCLGGCRKAKPSPEYASALALYTSLYRESLDDAYEDPRMAEVQALLTRVEAQSVDAPAAKELLTKIGVGRARLEAEAEVRRQAIAEAVKPTTYERSSDEPAAEPAAAVVAAPEPMAAEPTAGMSLGDFSSKFGGCFEAGPPVTLPGKSPVDSYALKDLGSCRTKFPGYGGTVVAIENGKVLGRVRLNVDAGR